MQLITRLVGILILFVVLGTIDFSFLLLSYGVLRLLRISVNWVTWLVGALIILASGYTCLLVFFPSTNIRDAGLSNVMGAFSFLIAVHSGSQWTTRRWYLVVKKGTAFWMTKATREVLLFLRKHHQFLGWLVLITAEAHTFYFLQYISRSPSFKIITGFIALALLLIIAILGLWIDYRKRKKRVTQKARRVHALLTIALFAAFVVHVS